MASNRISTARDATHAAACEPRGASTAAHAHGAAVYTIDKRLQETRIEDALIRTRKALAEHGFGVLSEIDVRQTLKSRIAVDLEGYVILGACNPRLAYEALCIEPKIGTMLPCNIVLRASGRDVEVSAIDPAAAMRVIDNPKLRPVAENVADMLRSVLGKL